MPFVNVQIVKGHPQQARDKIARKVAEAINEATGIPKDSVWVVFEEVAAEDWYVGERSVADIRKDQR